MIRIGKVEPAHLQPGQENARQRQPEKIKPQQPETTKGKFDELLQLETKRIEENLVHA